MSARKSLHHIPERFLRQIWKHKHFQATGVNTIDGKPIEILSPGTFNRDGGPDFINASIRIGGVLYRGDVELHQRLEEWMQHFHHQDPKYNSVILHVVLIGPSSSRLPVTESRRALPVLALDRYLKSTYRSAWKTMIAHERAERSAAIRCAGVNEHVEAPTIRQWIEKLAIERIEVKIRRYEERLQELFDQQRLILKEPARHYNTVPFGLNPDEIPISLSAHPQRDYAPLGLWEQLLYEGIMEALGYSKNQRPFLRTAQNLTLHFLSSIINPAVSPEEVTFTLEAALFGIAGLLPLIKEMADKESKVRVRQLRNHWKQIRPRYHHELLNKGEWQFFRLRPENFPSLRLAGAAQLIPRLLRENYFKTIIRIVKTKDQTGFETYRALEEMFIVRCDEFWSSHYRFGERASSTVRTLIGRSRAADIVVNTIIPISLLYARIFKNKEIRENALALFRGSPPESENSVIRTMEEQLIKGKFRIDSSLLHQGTIHLNTSYCLVERCGECAIGKIVF